MMYNITCIYHFHIPPLNMLQNVNIFLLRLHLSPIIVILKGLPEYKTDKICELCNICYYGDLQCISKWIVILFLHILVTLNIFHCR